MSSEEEKLAREQERLLKSINSKSDIQTQMKKKKEEAERKKKLEEKKKKEEEDRRLAEEKRKEELRIKEENRRKWLEQEAEEEERKKKEQEEQKKTVSVQAAFDINEDEQLKKEEARMMKSMTEFFGGKVPQQSSTTKNPPNMALLNYDPDSKTVVEKEEDRWAKQFGKATILETPPVNPLLSHKHEATDPTSHETAVPPAPPVYTEGSVVVGNSQATVGTDFESDVWSELNKARMTPHQYANTLIELVSHYEGADGVTYKVPGTNLKRKTQEGVRALHEAIKFLQHATPCPVLELSPGFSLSAQELVTDQGKTGDTSTKLSDGTDASVRLLRYGFWKKKVAELLSYGAASPKDVVHQWLLDDGNKSRPNRKTLFDPELKVVGISSGPHPSFGRVVVASVTVSFTEGETRLAPTLATSDEFVVGNFFIPPVSSGPERVELDTTESRTDVTIQVVPSKYSTEASLKCKSGVVEFSFKHEEEIGTVAGRAKASIVSTRTVKLPFAPEKNAFSISTQDPSKLTVKINKAFRK